VSETNLNVRPKRLARVFHFIRKHWAPITAIGAYLFILIFFFFISLPDVSYLKTHNPKTTSLIELRKEQAAANGKKLRIRQHWVPFRRIPKLLRRAVRITEDASFYRHNGIDYEEIKEAIKKDLSKGRLARGGSTITQQLAKNLYLSTQKSFYRKIREYFIARRLEAHLSKNRIFHLYLNVIEFGHGIFGVQAAARYYFKRNVDQLNLEQIIRLTAVIPRPLSIRPTGKSRRLKWKCRWILRKLLKYGYISKTQFRQTLPAFER